MLQNQKNNKPKKQQANRNSKNAENKTLGLQLPRQGCSETKKNQATNQKANWPQNTSPPHKLNTPSITTTCNPRDSISIRRANTNLWQLYSNTIAMMYDEYYQPPPPLL
jgi:hypothetical protein